MRTQDASRARRVAEFISDRQPPSGLAVQLLCEDNRGTYTLPFQCEWSPEGWLNAATRAHLDATVLGWRERAPSQDFSRGARTDG